MKQKGKILLLLMLVLALCLPTFVGCKKTEAPVDTDSSATETSVDSLPDNLDFNEDTVRVLHWEEAAKPEFNSDDMSNIVGEALYRRNLEITTRLNINLKWIPTPGRDISVYSATLYNDYMSNSYEYDILAGYSQSIATATYNSFTRDLMSIEYLDLSQPWWPDSLTENAQIGNKLYFVSGDISTNALYFMYATFFNKNMLESYKLENPYDLVENNQWTLEKMFGMTKGIYKDYGTEGKDVKDELGIIIPLL